MRAECPRLGLGVRGVAVVLPGEFGGALGQDQPEDPDHGDADHVRRDPECHGGRRELCTHDDDGEDGDDDGALQDESQTRCLVGEGVWDADAEAVQGDEHDGLDRDSAQDVADRDVDLPVQGRRDRDGDLGQVGCDGEQDQSAESGAEVQPVRYDVGVVRQEDPGDPDRASTEHEGQHRRPQRQARQEHVVLLTEWALWDAELLDLTHPSTRETVRRTCWRESAAVEGRPRSAVRCETDGGS